MSAWIVSKTHIDLLVRAAIHYGQTRGNNRFRWWEVDENGAYAGWRQLEPHATENEERAGYMTSVPPSFAGQILVSENVRSVTDRYPDTDADKGDLPGPIDAYYMGPYVYTDPGYVLNPAEVFHAIDCLDYQSCEHDDWPRSEAYAFLRELRELVCRAVPGAESSPWGWETEDVRDARERVAS